MSVKIFISLSGYFFLYWQETLAKSRKKAKDLLGFSMGMRRGFPAGFSSYSSDGQQVPAVEGRTRTVSAALFLVLLEGVG